jgi:hypothetical protein
MLARLTAQTSWADTRIPGGGKPELTVADISVIAAAAPHMSYHALMTKYCDDQGSERVLLSWTHQTSLDEWFTNPQYAALRIEARQLNRLAELALLAWLKPQAPHATTIQSRAAYVGANHETFRRNFQAHYAFLIGELGFLEQIGLRAVVAFRGKKE